MSTERISTEMWVSLKHVARVLAVEQELLLALGLFAYA